MYHIILLTFVSFDICLAFINRNIHNARINTVTLYDDHFLMNKRNRVIDGVIDRTNKDLSLQLSSKQSDLQSSLQISFMDKLSAFNDGKEFVSYLKATSQKRIALSNSDRQRLAGELIYRVPHLSASQASDVLWSLGTLKISVKSKDNMQVVVDLLLKQLDYSQHSMTSNEMALALVGLGRLGLKSPSGTGGSGTAYSSSFLEALSRTLISMDSMQVANCMWALGKYGIRWDSLTVNVQKAYQQAIIRVAFKMNSMAVANTIHGLSHQRAQWKLLSPRLRDSLCKALEARIEGMHEQEVSNCISGLGRLGAEWSDLTPTVRGLLGDAFSRTLRDIPPRGLAMSIHGFGRMNTNFVSLPLNIQSSIMRAVQKISSHSNSLEVSNILYGLGKMGAIMSINDGGNGANISRFLIPGFEVRDISAGELDSSLTGRGSGNGSIGTVGVSEKARESLLEAFNREGWMMNAQGIANSLWGLMLTNAQWSSFSSDLKNTVISAVRRELATVSEQELSNTLYALGKIGMKYDAFPAHTHMGLLHTIENRIVLMSPDGIIMTLLGLGKLGVKWGSMPIGLKSAFSGVIEKILVKASERTVSSLVLTLSSVYADWNDLCPTLQSAFIKSMENPGNLEQQEERKLELTKPHMKDGTNIQSKKQYKDKNKESHIPQNQTYTDVNRPVVVSVDKVYQMSNMTSGSNITPGSDLSGSNLSGSNVPSGSNMTSGAPVKHGRSPIRASRAAFGAILSSQSVKPKQPSNKTPTVSTRSTSSHTSILSSSSPTHKASKSISQQSKAPKAAPNTNTLLDIHNIFMPSNLDAEDSKATMDSQLSAHEKSPPMNSVPKKHPPSQSPQIENKNIKKIPKINIYNKDIKVAPLKDRVYDPINHQIITKDEYLKVSQSIDAKKDIINQPAKIKSKNSFKNDEKIEINKKIKSTKIQIVDDNSTFDFEKVVDNYLSSHSKPVTVDPKKNTFDLAFENDVNSYFESIYENKMAFSDSKEIDYKVLSEFNTILNSINASICSVGSTSADTKASASASADAKAGASISIDSNSNANFNAMTAGINTGKTDVLESPSPGQTGVGASVSTGVGASVSTGVRTGPTWELLGLDARITRSNDYLASLPLMDDLGVVDTLKELTGLNATWQYLRPDVQEALKVALERTSNSMNEESVSTVFLSLGNLNIDWKEDLSESLKVTLIDTIIKQFRYGETSLSRLLCGLGKLSFKWAEMDGNIKTVLIESILNVHTDNKWTHTGLSDTLNGLSETGLKWSSLNNAMKITILDEFSKLINTLTATEISNVLNCLGNMNLKWMDMSNNLQHQITGALTNKAEGYNEWHISTILFALGSLGLKWTSLPPALRGALTASLERVNKTRNIPVKVCNDDYIGNNNANENNYEDYNIADINIDYNGIMREKELQLSAQGVCMTVSGLARLSAVYSHLSNNLIASISLDIQQSAKFMTVGQIASVISGLSAAEWSWEYMGEGLRSEILSAVLRTIHTTGYIDTASIMSGLGTMGVRWMDLSPATREVLEQGVKKTALEGGAEEVAGVTYGLGMMECTWEGLPLDLRRSIAGGILRICGAHERIREEYNHVDNMDETRPMADSGIMGAARFAAQTDGARDYRSSRTSEEGNKGW
eukprot:CAMPEP_0119051996 /NCGR_PEP_ID=MMETSP1177-20130426/73436_1 /TAXON_ID=2985 /ORGANISM="Ochromonas sp, Strain CCMP1899" /LENGTH=1626 /DNA_ID=CAMNT_0007031409 /DNA_START=104 /DNA_END=4981 /DNA_ORIENTATION=-